MGQAVTTSLIDTLFSRVLGRAPSEKERHHWAERVEAGFSAEDTLTVFLNSREYQARNKVVPTFPNGHYHSPIVDPETVGPYVERERQSDLLPGISLDASRMRTMWCDELEFIRATPFGEADDGRHRYWYNGGPYPYGDAIVLRMMIKRYRPKRIVEIGSGFSTACMLDTADEINLSDLQIFCVEPFPARLRSVMRPEDHAKITILEKNVQDVGTEIVAQLEENDILFVDSSHVMKTGSDVHFEFFHLLPAIQPGVILHFHDVPFPFEYPDKWLYEKNYSWNEAYVLRAFLMYNDKFSVEFWNSFVAKNYSVEIRKEFPLFLRNPGSSLWARCNSI